MDRRRLVMPVDPPTWGGIVLRAYRDADVGMVMDLSSDPYVPTIGTLSPDADEEEARAYVARQQGRVDEGVGWSFCVADRETDEALGGAGLWLVPDDPHRTTAGYTVAPRSRGRGIAARALRALTGFAWSLPEVQRVELFVEPWNVASLRTAEAAGYAREALLNEQAVGERRADLVRFAAVRP